MQWIVQYLNESLQNKNLDNQNKCNLLIQRICDECVRSIMIALDDATEDVKKIKMYNEMIIQSSLICLLSISCSIKPKFLLELPSIQHYFERLYSSINTSTCPTCLILTEQTRIHSSTIITNNSCTNCTKYINQLVTLPSAKCTRLRLERKQELIWIDSLSNILLLPWTNVQDNQQEWDKRSEKHAKLIVSFYADLIEQFKQQPSYLNQRIPANTLFGNTLKRSLFLFTNLINNHVESPSKSKQQLLISLIQFLEFVITILPSNILNDELGESILSFLISVLEVFRTQIKIAFLDQIIKVLLDCISQSNLLDSKPEYKNSLIEKIFKIFIFIVEQPSATFKLILPNMLDVVLDRLYQIVIHSNQSDLYSTFYEFLYKFLLNNSKFFFKTQLSISQLANCLNETANQQYFFRIFEIFGTSFLNTNLDIFQTESNRTARFKFSTKTIS